MNQATADKYLGQCRINYFLEITPANPQAKTIEEYKKLVQLAESYFEHNEYEQFAGFLREGQYLIEFWTAHLLLEYGRPPGVMRGWCLETIAKYAASSPLKPRVALEEAQWLKLYVERSQQAI